MLRGHNANCSVAWLVWFVHPVLSERVTTILVKVLGGTPGVGSTGMGFRERVALCKCNYLFRTFKHCVIPVTHDVSAFLKEVTSLIGPVDGRSNAMHQAEFR